VIEIRISSDPKLLTVVRATVSEVCELMDCPQEERRKVVLAVDEACTNIMKHTYHGDQSRTIYISCEGNRERLEFVLRDCGPRCDPESIRPRDIHDIRPGGLGTHFIRSIMDELDYGYEEGCGNVLRLVKHLNRS